jgi:predicted heme/steroid binding protein/uncharacterized membrane protein
MKKFGPEELGQFNGQDGKPVYVVHQGKVYDVSSSKLWRNGLHMKRHHAGQDLTTDFQAAPHGQEVLERYPQVGTVKPEKVPERKIPSAIQWLITRFPMLRRHPHPMTVHFPIVFMFSTTGFNLLYLITGVQSFETTALHCLGGGLLFVLVAVTTGIYTWWLNYMAKPLRAVKIKIPLSLLMFIVAAIVFVWRIADPAVLDSVAGTGFVYLLLVLSLSVMVTIIGWFGASMTFPIEKE